MKSTLFVKRPSAGRSLRDHDPANTDGYANKKDAKTKLKADIKTLCKLQDVLNAGAEHGVLIIFQGMDGAGKDSAIKHVMSGVNPQGVDVYSFKAPTEEERRHDYMWRCAKVVPQRGRIGIFNRSYYEEVLVTRVHPDLLVLRPPRRADDRFWKRRFRHINDFERYLVENKISVIKFYLHLSKQKQTERLLARLESPKKRWKFSPADLQQRDFWPHYMRAYEEMLKETSTSWAPWYVIPADHKWFAHVAIAEILVTRLGALKLRYPKLSSEASRAMRKEMRRLQADRAKEKAAE